ncbi:YbdD/YjiX family protein [Vulcaniibacterium thermophilum]|jgi:uncharacterized short protein YbdD (DUF466 family)|uniref:YbdD/YjiX family protein n=2 Tax=Vulcaniibacterium thermophilum TaxID=1169913 RepID=A0A918YUG8_9GAMM|nr:hypothetical protein GCM10007167_00820 [Vulcaniibacterium thermophilum]
MSRSMPWRAERWPERLRRAWRAACVAARMAVGLPDYDRYVAHARRMHPERPPMTREEFFRERLAARYGRGRSRCC